MNRLETISVSFSDRGWKPISSISLALVKQVRQCLYISRNPIKTNTINLHLLHRFEQIMHTLYSAHTGTYYMRTNTFICTESSRCFTIRICNVYYCIDLVAYRTSLNCFLRFLKKYSIRNFTKFILWKSHTHTKTIIIRSKDTRLCRYGNRQNTKKRAHLYIDITIFNGTFLIFLFVMFI